MLVVKFESTAPLRASGVSLAQPATTPVLHNLDVTVAAPPAEVAKARIKAVS